MEALLKEYLSKALDVIIADRTCDASFAVQIGDLIKVQLLCKVFNILSSDVDLSVSDLKSLSGIIKDLPGSATGSGELTVKFLGEALEYSE